MRVPRLISLFRSLDNTEVRKFGQFINSPYYQNATPKVKALYRSLKKSHPGCPFTEEDKKDLFKKIFKENQYKSQKMNNLIASLSAILQDFLILENTKNNAPMRKKTLYEVYRMRNLDKLSIQPLSGFQRHLEEHHKPVPFEFYEAFKTYHELYLHPETKRAQWQEKGEDYVYINKAWEHLELFFMHLKLSYICEMNFRKTPLLNGLELNDYDQKRIRHLVDTHDAPLLEIYGLMYTIQTQENADIYERVKMLILDYIEQYNPIETPFLLTFLINYQVGRTAKGDTAALGEMLNMYRYSLEKEIFTKNEEHFHPGHFLNASICASELGQTDWLEAFIGTWEGYLKNDGKADILDMSNAFLCFAQQKYEDAIRLSMKVRNRTLTYSLTCWTLEIRAYYMNRNKTTDWTRTVENFQAFLRRQDDIEENRKKANRNFVSLLKQLYAASATRTHTKSELQEKLDTYENLVCKYWLKKQIGLLRR